MWISAPTRAVVKACIAMEYPPRYQSANKTATGDALPLPVVPPDSNQRYLPETIQLAGTVERSRIVHLDLDPQNGTTESSTSSQGVLTLEHLMYIFCTS